MAVHSKDRACQVCTSNLVPIFFTTQYSSQKSRIIACRMSKKSAIPSSVEFGKLSLHLFLILMARMLWYLLKHLNSSTHHYTIRYIATCMFERRTHSHVSTCICTCTYMRKATNALISHSVFLYTGTSIPLSQFRIDSMSDSGTKPSLRSLTFLCTHAYVHAMSMCTFMYMHVFVCVCGGGGGGVHMGGKSVRLKNCVM